MRLQQLRTIGVEKFIEFDLASPEDGVRMSSATSPSSQTIKSNEHTSVLIAFDQLNSVAINFSNDPTSHRQHLWLLTQSCV